MHVMRCILCLPCHMMVSTSLWSQHMLRRFVSALSYCKHFWNEVWLHRQKCNGNGYHSVVSRRRRRWYHRTSCYLPKDIVFGANFQMTLLFVRNNRKTAKKHIYIFAFGIFFSFGCVWPTFLHSKKRYWAPKTTVCSSVIVGATDVLQLAECSLVAARVFFARAVISKMMTLASTSQSGTGTGED